jgi:Leucine-rich repeat (LRR) protein
MECNYCIILTFLSHHDYHNLLNTCSLFSKLKKTSSFLSVNRDHSIRYYNDESFREIVKSLILDPFRQLSINLKKYNQNLEKLLLLNGIHTLILEENQDLMNVSGLSRIHTLNLSNCRNITDVSCLGNCHTLLLTNCIGIQDVTALGCVHTLSLSGCSNISDVSALGNVNTLSLACTKISDVSS